MNRRTTIQSLLAAAGIGSTLSAMPPTRSETDRQVSTFRSDVALVMLDVSVKDNQGRFVPQLQRENFSVTEDGKPQRITAFDAGHRPVTVGLLIDQSRSITPNRQNVMAAALSLIEASNPEDEIFILHFNDRVEPGLPPDIHFSADPSQLRDGLSHGVPSGKTALNDAVIAGLEHLRLGRRDRKMLVLITDGGDTASAHSKRETLDLVERGNATVYAIGLYDSDDPDRDPGLLRQLAKISGGVAYFPNSPNELPALCRQIAEEIRARYTIGFIPQRSPSKAARSIRVNAEAPGIGRLHVHTRRSYRYE